MAEHRIVLDRLKTWPDREAKSQRLHCTGCPLNVKVAGIGVDDVIEAIIANHERTGS